MYSIRGGKWHGLYGQGSHGEIEQGSFRSERVATNTKVIFEEAVLNEGLLYLLHIPVTLVNLLDGGLVGMHAAANSHCGLYHKSTCMNPWHSALNGSHNF